MPKFPYSETFHPEKALSVGLKGYVPQGYDSDEVRKLKTIASAFSDFYQPESPLDFLWLQILAMSFFKLQQCWKVSIDDNDLSRGDVIKLESQLIAQIEKSTRKLELSLGRRLNLPNTPSESPLESPSIPKGTIPQKLSQEALDAQIEQVRSAIPLITHKLEQLTQLPEAKKLNAEKLLDDFKANEFLFSMASPKPWKTLSRDQQKSALEEIKGWVETLLNHYPKTSKETLDSILENLETIASKQLELYYEY